MAISGDSKQAIRQEIDRLEGQRNILNKRIQELKEKRDPLILRRDEINTTLDKLKADLNG